MTTRLLAVLLVLALGGARAEPPPFFARSLLHAHNCYPDEGQWADRIDRALAIGLRPIAIEQDIAWVVGADGVGRSVVAHEAPATGREPSLESVLL